MTKRYYFNLRKSHRTKGFLLLFFVLTTFLALISYDGSDACLNVINDAPINNLLGSYGAVIADLFLQYLGFSAYYLLFILFSLSIIMLYNKKINLVFFRIIFLIISTSSLSFLFGSFTKYNYKFQILPGGYLGFFLFDYIANLFYIPISVLITIVLLFASFYLIFINLTIIKHKKDNKDIKNKSNIQPKKQPFYKKNIILRIIYFILFQFYAIFRDLIKFIMLSLEIAIRTVKMLFNTKKNTILKQKNVKINNNEHKKIIHENFIDKYIPPSILLLKEINNKINSDPESLFKVNMAKLHQVLLDFGVRGDMIGYKQGPVVTLYEFKPYPGIKSSRIIGLADDIARTMMVLAVRIAIIPGKDTIGIEMPNKDRATVCFRELVECNVYKNLEAHIPLILGCDIFGNPIIADLTTMPHLLVAGTTGSGKSVGVNGMILSIIYKLSPQKCKFIMIDPKMLEFSMYNNISHLMMPVITEAKKAVLALKYVVKEMENRYRKMSSVGVRNIYGYNEKVLNENLSKEEHEYLPFIVVIIDEMADLMIVAGKEIEVLVQRLSQMARAAGIHLIMATQRPSVDVITGVIKANFPTRISYQVTSKIDSRTILGEQGAEQLLGKGDMLYMIGGGKTIRVHGPFVSDGEVEVVTKYLKEHYQPNYIDLNEEILELSGDEIIDGENLDEDSLYKQAVRIVLNDKKPSISYLQRRLRIGYNKSANLIEQMEQEGILSSADNTGRRTILKNNGG